MLLQQLLLYMYPVLWCRSLMKKILKRLHTQYLRRVINNNYSLQQFIEAHKQSFKPSSLDGRLHKTIHTAKLPRRLCDKHSTAQLFTAAQLHPPPPRQLARARSSCPPQSEARPGSNYRGWPCRTRPATLSCCRPKSSRLSESSASLQA